MDERSLWRGGPARNLGNTINTNTPHIDILYLLVINMAKVNPSFIDYR
jgi:hypothetical protein